MMFEDQKIELIVAVCKKHGEFAVNLVNHLAGEGCPVCESSYVARTFVDGFNGPVNISYCERLH